ncbi:unnamed protein product [Leptosia nina]|uniref:Uncharacterized protein n=1 Tax=Leptosia nina TaxID=320188 RepID=A0AAV1K0T5_9NEOP
MNPTPAHTMEKKSDSSSGSPPTSSLPLRCVKSFAKTTDLKSSANTLQSNYASSLASSFHQIDYGSIASSSRYTDFSSYTSLQRTKYASTDSISHRVTTSLPLDFDTYSLQTTSPKPTSLRAIDSEIDEIIQLFQPNRLRVRSTPNSPCISYFESVSSVSDLSTPLVSPLGLDVVSPSQLGEEQRNALSPITADQGPITPPSPFKSDELFPLTYRRRGPWLNDPGPDVAKDVKLFNYNDLNNIDRAYECRLISRGEYSCLCKQRHHMIYEALYCSGGLGRYPSDTRFVVLSMSPEQWLSKNGDGLSLTNSDSE